MGADTQTKVETDITKLVPQAWPLQNLNVLERATGVGWLDLMVSEERGQAGHDRMDESYQSAVLKRWLPRGRAAARRGCARPSLPDLFRGQAATGLTAAPPPSKLSQDG